MKTNELILWKRTGNLFTSNKMRMLEELCFQLSYWRRKISVVEKQAANIRPKPGKDPRLGSGTFGQTDAVAEEASRLLQRWRRRV